MVGWSDEAQPRETRPSIAPLLLDGGLAGAAHCGTREWKELRSAAVVVAASGDPDLVVYELVGSGCRVAELV